ncbi:MurR/RpiR family transcriptional regulator [Pediococcus pentosaceus]|uniref:MurR/RpiR family transcriptional regulator n=1 Tax=Pediococcus pentosaceus TaxID=1255 RepID=UPI001E5BED37|nr:hypothetical protein [Pediococcus pentosaceus]
MKNILFTLSNDFEKFSRSEQKVARFMIDYPREVIQMNAEEISDRTQVSPATVVRLAKKICKSGLPGLKIQVASEIKVDDSLYTEVNPSDDLDVMKHKLEFRISHAIGQTNQILLKNDVKKATDIVEQALDEYIANFEEIYGISLDPIQRKKFAYWLAITLERSQITLLNIKSAKKQIINNDPNFDLMWQWNKKGELTLNQDELYFLYQVIYVFGIIDGNPNYENSYALAHQKNQTHAYQAVMNLALVIKKTFNFQLGTTDLELMFNFIAFHERSTFFMEILTCFSTVPT